MERILQFGSGMLLRALCDAAIDAAHAGQVVVVQSTRQGAARTNALNARGGCFTLIERGLSDGKPVDRTTTISVISRALSADTQWDAVRDVAASPEMRVIISNVSEAGFRPDAPFPARLTDALHARFTRVPDAPPVFVIPTELVPDNGPRLKAMVCERAPEPAFRAWLDTRVRFCSSLVDRIVTAGESDDPLLTVAEPYAFWAIEADPAELREAFPVESEHVVFAPDITFYRERKLRLLNAVHTATAPIAIQAGVRFVREAVAHPALGPFMKELLEEIIPRTNIPEPEARAFAEQVLERFANPWLDHEYRVIATNQAEKFKIRVAPLLNGRQPGPALARAAAANEAFTCR